VADPRPPSRTSSRRKPPRTGSYAAVGRPGTQSHPSVPADQVDPTRTGYFKPLPAAGRAARLWAKLGLLIGQRMAMVVRDDHIYLISMAAVVGVTSGTAAGLLLMWIDAAIGLFPTADEQAPWLRWPVLVGVPVVGGLLVGLLRYFSRRHLVSEIAEGPPAVVEAVAHRGGALPGPGGLVLAVGTGLTIGSGGSVGHEGPTVALGATVGSVVARFFGLRLRRQTAMVGAGAAAGLAAAFNAPLAGVIFTVEVVFRRSVGGNVGTMSVFTPLVVAAVAGTFTSHAIFGARYEFDVPVRGAALAHMPLYLILAVLAGVVAPAMTSAVMWSCRRFDALKIPEWIKPGVGGLGVGLLGALAFTDLLGPGRGTVDVALHDGLVVELALALLALKIVATSLTIGSGGMGGIFMPSLFMGACLGTAVHGGAALAFPAVGGEPGAFALVGMGAFLGAMLRAPLTPIVMMFELTHDYGLILPLMFACILSAFVAGRIQREPIWDQMLRRRGRPYEEGDAEAEVMRRGRVGELMFEPDHMLRESSSFEEIQRAALLEERPTLYVLDDDEQVVGMIESTRIAAAVLRGEVDAAATARDLMLPDRPTLLHADDTLAAAMLAFSRSQKDVLPVVDPARRLRGLIQRHDLIAHYTKHVLERDEEPLQVAGGAQGPDQEVGLGAGIVLERVVVGRGWAGRTLADLDVRGRLGVQVLEWRRGEELVAVDPRRPLREGDILAVAGDRAALLSMRWET
jgi:CIC family chloride channel protein